MHRVTNSVGTPFFGLPVEHNVWYNRIGLCMAMSLFTAMQYPYFIVYRPPAFQILGLKGLKGT